MIEWSIWTSDCP